MHEAFCGSPSDYPHSQLPTLNLGCSCHPWLSTLLLSWNDFSYTSHTDQLWSWHGSETCLETHADLQGLSRNMLSITSSHHRFKDIQQAVAFLSLQRLTFSVYLIFPSNIYTRCPPKETPQCNGYVKYQNLTYTEAWTHSRLINQRFSTYHVASQTKLHAQKMTKNL